MVRTATVADAEQLNALNNEFNGEGETTLENIRDCLSCNPQEVSNTSLPFSLKESPQIWYDHNNFKSG